MITMYKKQMNTTPIVREVNVDQMIYKYQDLRQSANYLKLLLQF